MKERYLSVPALSKYIAAKFDQDPYLREVYVTGEVSNLTSRGHIYFNLKGGKDVLSAILFSSTAQRIDFQLKEGMKVNVVGEIRTFSGQSRYQMIVRGVQADGVGKYFLLLQELKEKLTREGLFESERKKTLSRYPQKIAVITSPTGAVIRDIVMTVKRRYPIAQIVLFPTPVQGAGAGEMIAKNIAKADEMKEFDTLIVARGGGSAEDLWCFNEEVVVRAIFQAETPVISSVGHETDTTLSDFVADVRAATPTAAAELATPVLTEELLKINHLKNRLYTRFNERITREKNQVERLTQSYLFTAPNRFYEPYIQRVNLLKDQCIQNFQSDLQKSRNNFSFCERKFVQNNPQTLLERNKMAYARLKETLPKISASLFNEKEQRFLKALENLDLLSPVKILLRGYAIVKKEEKVIKSIAEVTSGDIVTMQVTDGAIHAKVIEKAEEKDGKSSKNL